MEDDINILVNCVGVVADRKILTPDHKKTYRKHHRGKGILFEALPYSEYIKIIYKFIAKTIFETLCSTYEGNQQVKKAKANLLVQHYELFKKRTMKLLKPCFMGFKFLC